MASSVVMALDPNEINTNTNMVNGIPQYQDMYLFVELVAEGKGKTIISTSKGNNTSTSFGGEEPISFLGNNQIKDDPNYFNFTTNYYDGSTGNNIQYESFGINNIKIKTNSSYVPQVNIQFVDIRGLSFFNQENSPYRILFDFPAPTFTLTVKGYYGKGLKYRLHLVRYTSEFLAQNGNFIIDAEFIAQTFAPLSDIPLRYIINMPLIKGESLNPDANQFPKNTFEMILKIQNLYSDIKKQIDSGTEIKEYDTKLKNIEKIDQAFLMINSITENVELKSDGEPFLMIRTKNIPKIGEDGPILSNREYYQYIIGNTSEFDKLIANQQNGGVSTQKQNEDTLYIAHLSSTNPNAISYQTQLNNFAEKLKNITNTLPVINKINLKASFLGSGINVKNNAATATTYEIINITDFYNSLYKQKTTYVENKINLAKDIGKNVNSIILERLGMFPTIYNIFKVILDDVDSFFAELSSVSIKAYEEHQKSKNIIQGNNKSTNETIFSFPLILDNKQIGCGKSVQNRVSPNKLMIENNINFPEMDLVKNFIKTFQKQADLQKLYSMKEEQNEDGSNLWLPISPLDSALSNISIQSPYIEIYSGNINSDNYLTQILRIVLKRFYILTQGVIQNKFFSSDRSDTDNTDNAIIDLYCDFEVYNLVNSLNAEPQVLQNIKENAKRFNQNINTFYSEIEKITDVYENKQINLSNFSTTDNIKFFPIKYSDKENGLFYLNRNNSEFKGFNENNNNINLSVNTNLPLSIENFKTKLKDNWLSSILGVTLTDDAKSFFVYTSENVLYVQDNPFDDSDPNSRGVSITSRFLLKTNTSFFNSGISQLDNAVLGVKTVFNFSKSAIDNITKNIVENLKEITSNNSFNDFIENGNVYFNEKIDFFDKLRLQYGDDLYLRIGGNIVNIWVNILTQNCFNDYFYNTIINPDTRNENLTNLMILSNFGYNLSAFNKFPTDLNGRIFDIPAAIEVPSFLLPYMGILVDAHENNWVDDIETFFDNLDNNENKGMFIAADIHDINKYLSANDKKTLQEAYATYLSNQSIGIENSLTELYNNTRNKYNEKTDIDIIKKEYEIQLNSVSGIYYSAILSPLINRTSIINYGELTFSMETPKFLSYRSIDYLRNQTTEKTNVDKYFIKFFQNLFIELNNIQQEKEKEALDTKKTTSDEDIMNQLYYSFKNINDRWLSDNDLREKQISQFPFIERGSRLIDSFAFVDRAMNPIGDTVINAEILLDLFDDPNISLYSALSQILSTNGFEFFPLQNFMNISNNDWYNNTFKIDTSGIIEHSSAFVCMYVGGTSSYPSLSDGDYTNDGILDLENPDLKDFQSCDENNVNTEQNSKKFKFGQVRAFKVKFGEQNQSMFTNIKIDSKEYPETNESIQILSRLAGDNNANAPIPKGQNLYNLYENRAYKATITSLGNVMIQPTQYFQLENIPMFNGAYLILDVEHTIEPNKMSTMFSGTKILKYPVPRVTNPVVFVGLDEITGDQDYNSIVSGLNIIPLSDDFNISKYVTYEVAIRNKNKLPNFPNEQQLNSMKALATNIYDKLCDYYNIIIPINPFFRNPIVNEMAKGATGSKHLLGKAMDIDVDGSSGAVQKLNSNARIPSNSEIFYYIINNLEFDALIWEIGKTNTKPQVNPSWIHVQYDVGHNRRGLSIINKKTGTDTSFWPKGTSKSDLDQVVLDFENELKKQY